MPTLINESKVLRKGNRILKIWLRSVFLSDKSCTFVIQEVHGTQTSTHGALLWSQMVVDIKQILFYFSDFRTWIWDNLLWNFASFYLFYNNQLGVKIKVLLIRVLSCGNQGLWRCRRGSFCRSQEREVLGLFTYVVEYCLFSYDFMTFLFYFNSMLTFKISKKTVG